jgi:hypothetical protein
MLQIFATLGTFDYIYNIKKYGVLELYLIEFKMFWWRN